MRPVFESPAPLSRDQKSHRGAFSSSNLFRVFCLLATALAVPLSVRAVTVQLGPSTLQQTAPGSVNYVLEEDFSIADGSYAGDVTAAVTAVDLDLGLSNTSTSGCETTDFVGFPVGHIALIQRGACSFLQKADNAVAAGASAVIIFNQGDTAGRVGLLTLSLPTFTGGIPVFSATYALGEEWAALSGLEMHIGSDVFVGSAEEAYLRFCEAHPDGCTLSIRHVTQGWERHLNPDRPQVTASTFKVLSLIAYAEAVAGGDIDPNEVIGRDEWARYSVRRDAGALEAVFDRLGDPTTVTVDEMVRGMLRESDNATPDWLLGRLGRRALERVVRRYVRGYHDVPVSINSVFVLNDVNPLGPDTATRLLEDYSGFDALGYRQEVTRLFENQMQDPNFPQAVLDLTCQSVPWKSPPPDCVPAWETSTAQYRELLGNFFTQTTSRTLMRLMDGILAGTLLPPDVAAVVSRHLEYRLEDPETAEQFSRYGAKGGSFAPQNVCNWVAFAEDAESGDQVIVSTFNKDSPHQCGSGIQPWTFTEQLASNPEFAQLVRDAIPEEEARPELLGRVVSRFQLPFGFPSLFGFAQIRNIGSADAGNFLVNVLLSDDRTPSIDDDIVGRGIVRRLRSGGWIVMPFRKIGGSPVAGRYLLLETDSFDAVLESVESNNLVIDRLH